MEQIIRDYGRKNNEHSNVFDDHRLDSRLCDAQGKERIHEFPFPADVGIESAPIDCLFIEYDQNFHRNDDFHVDKSAFHRTVDSLADWDFGRTQRRKEIGSCFRRKISGMV